jgi:hypothetical protein
MRAVLGQHADGAVRVAKGNQVLTQQSEAQWRTVRLGQFFGEQGWHPEAADELAHRRASVGSGRVFVFSL